MKIWTVSPPGYSHVHAFDEIKLCLESAISKLESENIHSDLTIVLGGHLLRRGDWYPENMVFYNLEQIDHASPWMKGYYAELLQKYPVWDYSRKNIERLAEMGISAKHLPIGYMPCLTRINNLSDDIARGDIRQDIDVLFYGSLNSRRDLILSKLEGRGLRVARAFNCYGEERDDLIARSKIVLNLHFYGDDKPFEIARCSYLMANSKCIVSETGSDIDLEAPFYDCIAFRRYDDLVQECVELIRNGAKSEMERRKLENAAFRTFSMHSQAGFLKAVI